MQRKSEERSIIALCKTRTKRRLTQRRVPDVSKRMFGRKVLGLEGLSLSSTANGYRRISESPSTALWNSMKTWSAKAVDDFSISFSKEMEARAKEHFLHV